MRLTALPAMADNYIWMLHNGREAVVCDPGEAAPAIAALRQQKLALAAILVTHHHADHTGGVAQLQAETGASVFGPAREAIPGQVHAVRGGDQVQLLVVPPLNFKSAQPGYDWLWPLFFWPTFATLLAVLGAILLWLSWRQLKTQRTALNT